MDNAVYSKNKYREIYSNSENILRSHFYKIIVFLFCTISVILVCYDWIEHYYGVELFAKRVTRAFMFLIFLIVIFDPGTLQKKKARFFMSLPLIILCYLFITYALFEDNLISGLYYSSRIIFWIAGTFFVYRMLSINALTHNHLNLIICIIIMIYSIMIFFFMFNPNIIFRQNISIYALVWCVPILMLSKNTFWRNIFIIMAFMGIMVSFKRGAMLALILSAFSYLVVYFWINRSFEAWIKTVVLMLALVFITSISLAVVYEVRPEFFEKRVSDITEEDQAIGSGRGDFFPFIFNRYISSFHSSPKNFFFGYGSRSVEQLTGGMYAHSDWLQLLHDYGLLGFFVLALIHINIIILILKGIKKKFTYVPALTMIYSIFFSVNIYSGQIFSPNTIYFGIFLSLYYKLWLTQQYTEIQ
jgi:O-antigen ligase